MGAEFGNRREAARGGDTSHRNLAAAAPGVGFEFATLAQQTDLDRAGKAAAAQHEQRRKGLLQANRTERHVTRRARDGAADQRSLLRVDSAVSRRALGDAEQAQGPRQRQDGQRNPHRKKKQRRLAGAPALRGWQREKTRKPGDQASLTTSCSAICLSRVVTSAAIVPWSAS